MATYIKNDHRRLKLMSSFRKTAAFQPSPLPDSSGRQATSRSVAPHLQNAFQHSEEKYFLRDCF